MIRTFHNHKLFHYPGNRGQEVLEVVLRRISDNFFNLGYCQGMNYVAGAVIVSLADPQLVHFCSESDLESNPNSCQIQSILSEFILLLDERQIIDETYSIITGMIFRLQLSRLWGYGFPDMPLYSYALKFYLQYTHSLYAM